MYAGLFCCPESLEPSRTQLCASIFPAFQAFFLSKSDWVIYNGHVLHTCLVNDLDCDFHPRVRQVERNGRQL